MQATATQRRLLLSPLKTTLPGCTAISLVFTQPSGCFGFHNHGRHSQWRCLLLGSLMCYHLKMWKPGWSVILSLPGNQLQVLSSTSDEAAALFCQLNKSNLGNQSWTTAPVNCSCFTLPSFPKECSVHLSYCILSLALWNDLCVVFPFFSVYYYMLQTSRSVSSLNSSQLPKDLHKNNFPFLKHLLNCIYVPSGFPAQLSLFFVSRSRIKECLLHTQF